MSTGAATAAPEPGTQAQAAPQKAPTTKEIKRPWLAPLIAAVSGLFLVLTVLTTGQITNPPITQMGWSIVAAIALGVCAKRVHELTTVLLYKAEIQDSELHGDIKHNWRLQSALIAGSALAAGIFIGTVY